MLSAATAPTSPPPAPFSATPQRLRTLLLALFVVSGFSALIYQSIWSHYLGLVLGHAAYAQTLVLMMFMGGMSLGAWLVSLGTLRWRRLILIYAVVEAAIGLLGWFFHPIFVAYSEFSHLSVLPALASPALASAWQWLSAGALIAPQTVLLGATFPLIAAGVLRMEAQRQGEMLGSLYFSNSIGAAVGVLVATFVLLPAWGMPGAMQVAAGLNLALALATFAISRASGEAQGPRPAEPDPETVATASAATEAAGPGLARLRPLLLLATFFSSAASFAYELGWVRLLNQALGSSLHSFELMLAAFIAGLAFGGLWIRRRGGRIADLLRYAGMVQVAMGICAMLSVSLLARSFAWVGWMMEALAHTGAGYVLYALGTASIALLIMVPAAFFAGMTLPLFTAALLRRGAGERVIGQVYAANTLGAILGVLLAVHLLLPWIGVSMTVLLAALVDVLVGVLLLRGISPGRWTPGVTLVSLLAAVCLGSVLQWGLPDRLVQSLGVFRHGQLDTNGRELVYFRDGATASTSVIRHGEQLSIATNGKVDAAVSPLNRPPSIDEETMLMLAALPLAAHPNPRDVAVIGWGSGLSTHTLLGSPLPRRVDTIEIERTMWEGASSLGARNLRAYFDPRSQVHFEDARQFLSTTGRRYDVLISEPSNPWVSGVASLFTQEFYQLARRSLKDDGLLVQWIHTYEISDALLAEMVAALLSEFPRSEVYMSGNSNLIILARKGATLPLNDAPWHDPELRAELRRVGLASTQDLQVRYVGGPAALRSFVRMQSVRPHSDYLPTVSLHAPAQRFQLEEADALRNLVSHGLPVLNILECRRPIEAGREVSDTRHSALVQGHLGAQGSARMLRQGGDAWLSSKHPGVAQAMAALLAQRNGTVQFEAASFYTQLSVLAAATLGLLDTPALQQLWSAEQWQLPRVKLPQAALTQLRLYASTADGKWAAAEAAARELLLDKRSDLPPSVREQVLVLGELASMAGGAKDALPRWEALWGSPLKSDHWSSTQRFLRAWEGAETVCAARPASPAAPGQPR